MDKCKVERAVRLGREYRDVRDRLWAVRYGAVAALATGCNEEQVLGARADSLRDEIALLALSGDERLAVMEVMKVVVKMSRMPESARGRACRAAGP